MSFERIIRRVVTEPWDIMPEHFVALVHRLPDVKDDWLDKRLNIRREDFAPRMENVGGVGVIRINGVLGKDLAGWELMLGACDYDDLSALILRAVDDPAVRAIVLDFDSGGGSGCGVVECAEIIAEARARKCIMAYTDSCMCSAAYWLAAGCTGIYASKSMYTGSIGTLLPILDMTKLYEQFGLRQELFVSGPLKGAGYPGTQLTEEQRAYFQNTVDVHSAEFKAHVLTHRPNVPAEAMTGRVFFGAEALKMGLIDSISDLTTCLDDARRQG